MPRRPRIKLAGIPQHLVQRGVNREPYFFADEDYYCYLHWLEEAAADWHCQIHAYVLMTNHVHLLVTPETEEGPAKLMQSIGRRYVQYINRVYRRTGTLWEGRYKSSAIQMEDYLLLCQRYIELNPVRAGMVDYPGQYQWSSYRHNGLGQDDSRLTSHPLYESPGRDRALRLAAHRELFRAALDDDVIDDIRSAMAQGRPLGADKFKEAICAATGVRLARQKRGRPEKVQDSAGLGDQPDFGF